MKHYTIGVDFGTLSARALLVDVENGREMGTAVMDYPHAVMDRMLPDGTLIQDNWALQHPQDYIDCMRYVVAQSIRDAGVSVDEIIGFAIDFTACSLVSVKADGTPLCFLPEYSSNPYAYVRLWKDHGAQPYADRINKLAHERNEEFIKRYGGSISSEWAFPKILQTYEEAPQVYKQADRFMEAGDWLVWQMTGNEVRCAGGASYKFCWSKTAGYPDKDFLEALSEGFGNMVDEKLMAPILAPGDVSGVLNEKGSEITGLPCGIPVAVCNIDAPVALPAAGVVQAGMMLMVMGTSTCHMLLSDEYKPINGICGLAEDGMVPGFVSYEAGQSCCGDHFAWFCRNCVPADYQTEAEERGISIQSLLTEKAKKLVPGESGLLALDWWNGNRSILCNGDLSGCLFGMTLRTRPEEIYRALIEATAYGTRMILDNYEENGVSATVIHACGGIANKNPMLMQIYADVTGREIRLARSSQCPALGSALFAAVAAGKKNGGYDTVREAAKVMGGTKNVVYRPIPENQKIYQKLYRQYAVLHDLFGRGGNDVLLELRKIRIQSEKNTEG